MLCYVELSCGFDNYHTISKCVLGRWQYHVKEMSSKWFLGANIGEKKVWAFFLAEFSKMCGRKNSIKNESIFCHKNASPQFKLGLVKNQTTEARKSIISWYPGYQPISNLTDNYCWREGSTSHHLRVNRKSVAELKMCATIKKNKRIIKS